MYLSKLIEDGCVRQELEMTRDLKQSWIATYKGLFFEGYENQTKRLRNEADALEIQISQNRENQTGLLVLNRKVVWWTKVASVVAAGILIMELVKYFYPPLSPEGETIVKQIGLFF